MNTTDKSINQIISSLIDLEAIGCHSFILEYGNGLFHVRIYNGKVHSGKVVYEKTLYPSIEKSELVRLSNLIETLKFCVCKTVYQCYKREFIKGEKSGAWEKTRPIFEVGENATQSMLIDGSGYYIDDPHNSLQYFVDYKNVSETH